MYQGLQPYVRLVGEAAQLPAEDGLGRLHLAQRQQGPARLPPGAVRLVRVVEERAPALRAQRVHAHRAERGVLRRASAIRESWYHVRRRRPRL